MGNTSAWVAIGSHLNWTFQGPKGAKAGPDNSYLMSHAVVVLLYVYSLLH